MSTFFCYLSTGDAEVSDTSTSFAHNDASVTSLLAPIEDLDDFDDDLTLGGCGLSQVGKKVRACMILIHRVATPLWKTWKNGLVLF